MSAQVRFKKDVYVSDISELRKQIFANGPRPALEEIAVSHPASAQESLETMMYLSFEPDVAKAPIAHSLDTLGFRNAHGSWHFHGLGSEFSYIRHYFPDPDLDGSYASLGYSQPLPMINDTDLADAVTAVGDYQGSYISAPVKIGMARLMIAINEAVRFRKVEEGIVEILGNARTFAPPTELIRRWKGHVLG